MKIFYSLIDFLFPRYCKVCGRRLCSSEEHLCITCLLAVPVYKNYKGGINLPEELLITVKNLQRAESLMIYDKESDYRTLLYHLKYYSQPGVGQYMSRFAAKRLLDTGFFDGVDMIVPVPLSAAKRRKRGYNQCDYIADGLNCVTGIPVAKDVVARSRVNTQQAGMGKLQRWSNAEGIFNVLEPEKITGKHLLVVDDVMTTGSTLLSLLTQIEQSVPSVKLSVFTLALVRN